MGVLGGLHLIKKNRIIDLFAAAHDNVAGNARMWHLFDSLANVF